MFFSRKPQINRKGKQLFIMKNQLKRRWPKEWLYKVRISADKYKSVSRICGDLVQTDPDSDKHLGGSNIKREGAQLSSL